MRITAIDAISANGKITNGSGGPSHTWTSAEDWEEFQRVRDSFPLIVMGRGTYEAVRPAPDAARLRVVLTHRPEQFADAAVPGQLEFLSAKPAEIVNILEARGFDRMLLVGGQVNSLFWRAGLVNEAFVTIEPLLFGAGRHLAQIDHFETSLQLKSVKKLNEQGTLQLHYLVDSPKHIL